MDQHTATLVVSESFRHALKVPVLPKGNIDVITHTVVVTFATAYGLISLLIQYANLLLNSAINKDKGI